MQLPIVSELIKNKLPILQHCTFFGMLLLSVFVPFAVFGGDFSAQKADFTVQVRDVEIPYNIMSIFVMPDEIVNLRITLNKSKSVLFSMRSSHGRIRHLQRNQWRWHAPKLPGLYSVNVSGNQMTDSMLLNIFVMMPKKHQQGEYLNGYRIGNYPKILFKGLPKYKPPRGFVEVSADNADTLVSPHFKLKQFLCKQNGEYPKYLVLKEKLLLKLELILSELNAKGYRCDTYYVMSGYRTPYYNKAIGNVNYSRHIYGGAADIFIDENPKDEMMDDLNWDGKIDYEDAAVIYKIIDKLHGKSFYQGFVGGLASYRKTVDHGPFVHVDVRGRRARWGD
jgi:hypothetical protein